jgi:alpha/beta hydrolase family protein
MNCKKGPRSRFPSSVACNAAWRNLLEWISKGTPPPHADPIHAENGKPLMDEFGNATGGVRSPFVDVPAAVWSGSSAGESFCFMTGNEKPFDHARLTQLYPDHKSYESKVAADVARLVKERRIMREDGDEFIAEAKKAAIP